METIGISNSEMVQLEWIRHHVLYTSPPVGALLLLQLIVLCLRRLKLNLNLSTPLLSFKHVLNLD